MQLEAIIQYLFVIVSIAALIWKWPGARYIPAALFAHAYAEHLCQIAMNGLHLWSYPFRIVPCVEMSVPANDIVIPIMTMFWLRYLPDSFSRKLYWIIGWSVGLTIPEYFAERYTGLIKYHNGYDWYFTLILWIITWFIFYLFHFWFWRLYHSEQKNLP